MTRALLRPAVDVLASTAVALGVLTLWLSVAPDPDAPARGAEEAARRLFLFMDIGLGVWIVLLVVLAVRARRRAPRGRRPGVRATLLSAGIGAVANLLTVLVVGLAQRGRVPTEFLAWAAQSGLAVLAAAAVVVPLVHRLLPNGAATERPPSTRGR